MTELHEHSGFSRRPQRPQDDCALSSASVNSHSSSLRQPTRGLATMTSRLKGGGDQLPHPHSKASGWAPPVCWEWPVLPWVRPAAHRKPPSAFGSGCNSGFQQHIKIASRTSKGREEGDLVPWLPEELDKHDSHLSFSKGQTVAHMTPDLNLGLYLSVNHRPRLANSSVISPHYPASGKERQM